MDQKPKKRYTDAEIVAILRKHLIDESRTGDGANEILRTVHREAQTRSPRGTEIRSRRTTTMKPPRLPSPTCRLRQVAALALFALCAHASAQSAFVFDDTVVRTYQIEISPQDWADILDPLGSGGYHPCTWRFGSEVYTGVQVRRRGESTSELEGPKPSLKVKFRTSQPFYNMKALSLDGHLVDATQMAERLSYGIYNRRGVNAPRYADARINLKLGSADPAYLGLFGVEELIDEGFLTRRFGDDRGSLYRMRGAGSDPFAYQGDDPGLYVPYPFEPKTDFTQDHAALVSLIRTVAETPSYLFREVVGTRMSMSTLMEYIAVESVIGEADGYLAEFPEAPPFYNNTFFYRLPADGRFSMVVWDRDNSFASFRVGWSVLRGLDRSNLTRWMWADGPSRAEYLSRCREIAEQQLNPTVLLPELDRVYQQIRPHVLEDPNKPVTNEQFEQAVLDLRQFIRQRYENVMREVR